MDYKDLKAGKTQNNFWFRGKNELIKVLMNRVDKSKRLKILNVGAGTGDDLEILHQFGDNYIIDIDADAFSVIDDKFCKEKIISDICKLPYLDNYFDVVVSFDVFEHILNDQKAVSEVHRVLKTDGVLVFTVPAFQFLFSSHDKALNHYRRYSKKKLKLLLFSFKNLKLSYWNSLLFIPIAGLRFLKRNSEPKIDDENLPSWLNTIFYYLLSVDNFLIRHKIYIPIGLSLVGLCKK